MGIKFITTDVAGQIADQPRRVMIVSSDNLATVTSAGYLNLKNLMGYTIFSTDIIDMWYGYVSAKSPGTFGMFTAAISASGVITLTEWTDPGNVLLPVVDGHFANFKGTSGQIADAGFSPSDATKTKVSMANGTVIANHIATYADTAGTIGVDPATAINGGNIQAGLSGTAGTLVSYPGTASRGSFVIAGVNSNAPGYNTVLSNDVATQSTTYVIPDVGNAGGRVLAAASTTPFVSGNLIKASGTGGVVVDQGFAMKSVAGAAAAGGAAAQSFTDAFCTSGSNVVGNWNTQANAASVLKIVPGNGSFVVTSSADAGVGTFNYIITK